MYENVVIMRQEMYGTKISKLSIGPAAVTGDNITLSRYVLCLLQPLYVSFLQVRLSRAEKTVADA